VIGRCCIILKNQEGLDFLSGLDSDSVDLVLVDPPYITSRDSGMDKWVDWVENQSKEDAVNIRTEEQWNELKTDEQWDEWLENNSKSKSLDRNKELARLKEDYLKYGSIYGKKYAVRTDYGEWDSEFTLESLAEFVTQFYRVLRKGGSCIVFFDLWKITDLKNILEESKFKQLRFIEWIKTNPQPINSKRNYLTNCREIALTAVKVGRSTFNSSYDSGIYKHPIYNGKDRFHPTQKSLPLFEELVRKHSSEGDVVLDCFAGSGTTAIAAIKNNRKFIGCEIDKDFYEKSVDRINKTVSEQTKQKE